MKKYLKLFVSSLTLVQLLTSATMLYAQSDYQVATKSDEVDSVEMQIQGKALLITLNGRFRADKAGLYNPLIQLNLDADEATGSNGYDCYLSGHKATALHNWNKAWKRKPSPVSRLSKTPNKIVIKISNIDDIKLPQSKWSSAIPVMLLIRTAENDAWLYKHFTAKVTDTAASKNVNKAKLVQTPTLGNSAQQAIKKQDKIKLPVPKPTAKKSDFLAEDQTDQVDNVQLQLDNGALIIILDGKFRADKSGLFNPLIKINLDGDEQTGETGYDSYFSGPKATALYNWKNNKWQRKPSSVTRVSKTPTNIVIKVHNCSVLAIPVKQWKSPIAVMIMARDGDNQNWVYKTFSAVPVLGLKK